MEFTIPMTRFAEIAGVVYEAAKHCTNTVFSWGLVVRYEEDGTIAAVPVLESMGIHVPKNAKVNVGLGKPYCNE